MEGSGSLTIGSGLGSIELDARWNVKSAPKHDRLASGENCHLIEQTACLQRNDAAEVINVIGILQTVADEVGALADDGLADFTGPLARNNE